MCSTADIHPSAEITDRVFVNPLWFQLVQLVQARVNDEGGRDL